ncbi:hypothetical protein BCR33DRAFT_247997 [Rhizoclosmatium globosum]|uniref:Uncharacterized protein n=1 Tax=Rhizoclosmatium globosum TaxID=329046 RepID=A0A1Y2CBS2_9FUNG|nr:hypothetical protein BCR33DRAFT_247997 [Rhizoclosmatium globosum]|eukprot:ORY43775.1 hypothetical protein BCR33DRAFT_247997 [Rhizoclosmatium globosum]
MRELLSKYRGVREIETFRRRAKTMLLVDRVQLLRDYKLLSEITPGSHLLETLTEYDGVNLFMDSPPLKSPKVEDYITEFEILCAHYNIETSMLQEDGRPFTYEVDGRFTCKFLEQVLETNFQPYDQSVDEKVNTPILSSNEKAALDVKSAAVANAIFVLNSSGVTLPSAPRLKSSDWLNENTLNPQFEEYQDRQADILKQQKDVDFELMCEIELMRSNEMEVVLHRLKENARKTWELASKKPNSKPLLAKSGVLSKPGTRAIQEPERTTLQPRLPESFDLGMMVPDGRDHLSDHHVLDGKKQNFGQILRANEELNNADQDTSELNKRQNPASVDPTIATIFAEHEINSYFMLRFIRIREYRNILRTQLNFFRSIEKRINVDLRQSRLRSKLDVLEHFKPTYQNIASILKTYDFESDESTGTLGSDGKSPNVTFGPTKMQETCSEDLRSFKKGYIEIKDQQGVSIIYDTALTDLQTLETELLKQATVFINNGYRGRTTAGGSFFDDLLLKRDRSKADIKDITFINPLVDRAQLLLELLDCEVKYQNAKVEVVNAYMDVFEHTTSYADIKKLGQVLTNLIFSRPDIDFSATYFSRDYAFATKNLHIQAAMVTSLVSRTIENHRDWIERHISKIQVPEGLDDQTGGTGSPLSIGLPWLIKSTTSQKATMHSPGISLHLNEIIPALSTVISIQKEAQAYCNQFYSLLQIILAKDGIVGIPNRAASKCVVWKGLNKLWREFCDQDFILPLKGRRLVGGLDNDDWLENPLLPDLILNEKYSPFDLQHASASSAYIPNMLSPYNMFTHPHFQPIGRDILVRSLKVLILRNRLYFSWIETDFWKFTYEEQFPQMGLEKNEYTGRLGAVNYDIPGMNDNTVVEDDDFEDLEGKEISYEAGDGHDGHGNVNTVHWRCGPLAIAELDDAHPLFDFSSLKSIMNIIRPLNISILTRTLKAQLVEKNWLMASAEINGFILHEIHKSAMCEKESDIKLDKNKPE